MTMYMTDYMAQTKKGRIIILKKAIEIIEEAIKDEEKDELQDNIKNKEIGGKNGK